MRTRKNWCLDLSILALTKRVLRVIISIDYLSQAKQNSPLRNPWTDSKIQLQNATWSLKCPGNLSAITIGDEMRRRSRKFINLDRHRTGWDPKTQKSDLLHFWNASNEMMMTRLQTLPGRSDLKIGFYFEANVVRSWGLMLLSLLLLLLLLLMLFEAGSKWLGMYSGKKIIKKSSIRLFVGCVGCE